MSHNLLLLIQERLDKIKIFLKKHYVGDIFLRSPNIEII